MQKEVIDIDLEEKIKVKAGVLLLFKIISIASGLLLLLGVYLSIHTDGLGVAIGIIIPWTALYTGALITMLVHGVRKRNYYRKWFVWLVVPVVCGLFFWTPLVKKSRQELELMMRMSTRKTIVEEIKSGVLVPQEGFLAIPFDEYGRVSFRDHWFGNENLDNIVVANQDKGGNWTISFSTDGGFFASKYALNYFDQPVEWVENNPMAEKINEHWYFVEGKVFRF